MRVVQVGQGETLGTCQHRDPTMEAVVSGGAPSGAEGGILILLGMPKGSEVGIDLKVYELGPDFRGFVGIPLGLHFITTGTGAGLRQGFFIFVNRPQEVVIKSWDPVQEELVEEGTGLSEQALSNLMGSLRSGQLANNLGPYPEAEQGALWRNLTNAVSAQLLARCGITLGCRILPGEWEEEKLPSMRRRAVDAMPVVPYFPEVGRAARFTDVFGERRPRIKPGQESCDPAQVTRFNMDLSQRLEELIELEYAGDWKVLLGELQLAFVMFMTLLSMAALKHWKESVALLCGCEEALVKRPQLYVSFVRVLFTQVKTIPPDFFEDEDCQGSFLGPAVKRLVQNVRDQLGVEEIVRENVERLVRHMEMRFKGLDLSPEALGDESAEDDEDKPVVVSLEEVHRVLGEIS